MHLALAAVGAESLWVASAQAKFSAENTAAKVAVVKGNYQSLASESLQQRFSDKTAAITLALPLPDGTFADFTLTPSRVMSADLAARYPQFMSYDAVQVNAPLNVGRFSLTHKGLTGIFQPKWPVGVIKPGL